MKSTRRTSRSRGKPRIPARARPGASRAARSFETLEGRFLLSGIDPVAISLFKPAPLTAAVVVQAADGQVDLESPAPFSGPRPTSTTVTLDSSPKSDRDDSYTFASVGGQTGIRVDFVWPKGPDPSDGHLLLSDAAGNVLYDLPLGGVDALHARLPIPEATGTTAEVDVDLQILRAAPNSPSTGSYQVALNFRTNASPIEAPSNVPTSIPFAAEIPAPVSTSIVTARNLPAPSTFSIIAEVPALRFGSREASAILAGPSSNGVSKLVTVSTTPMAVPASTITTVSRSFLLPLQGSGPGSSEGGQGARPTVVGPLPISGSGSDGGLFVSPANSSKNSNDPIQATLTIAPVVPLEPGVDPALDRPTIKVASPRPVGPRGVSGSTARLCGFDLEVGSGATGVAFLPPIAPLEFTRVVSSSPSVVASKPTVLNPKAKPKTSLAALLMGSAGLFSSLLAPDGIARLTAWKDNRRWLRRVNLGAAKHTSGPICEV